MSGGTTKQTISFGAVLCFLASLALPIVAFCLLRDAVPAAAYSEPGSRVAWLICTGLATGVLPLWHLWLPFWRAQGSLVPRFEAVIETSGWRICSLFVFTLPLLFVVASEVNSDLAFTCGFLWMIGFIGFVCTVPMFLVGVFDDPRS